MTQEYIGTQQVTAWEQEKDGQAGYSVKSADGNIVWMAKEAFEAIFVGLGHITALPPHQQRVLGERAQLAIKLTALKGFTQAPMFKSLPEAEQSRLLIQVDAMGVYHQVLLDRIAAF